MVLHQSRFYFGAKNLVTEEPLEEADMHDMAKKEKNDNNNITVTIY